MTKRKGIRLLAALALCFPLCFSFTLPAFAYAEDTEQELPVTEATQPEETSESETTEELEPYEGESFEEEGNVSTRDLLYDKATNKQFITIQTKSGNTFYIVIDYDAPINEEEEQYQTYFLNMVDEDVLLALMDETATTELTTCTCDSEYDRLYEAALARSKADWIVGINGTRLFSTLYHKKLLVGRVQTPTLAMLVEGEGKISTFHKEKYFNVHIGKDDLTADLEKVKAEAL